MLCYTGRSHLGYYQMVRADHRSFLNEFRKISSDLPIIAVPTTYNTLTESQLGDAGVNTCIVIFRNKSRVDWSNVMTQEPATGSYGGSGNQFSSFKRVVFNPVEFGMSIEPSTLGGCIETNTFYVWADSLPNYVVKSKLDFIGTTEVVNEYSKADRWMNNTQLFTWSMKKVDAGGNPNLTTDIKNFV